VPAFDNLFANLDLNASAECMTPLLQGRALRVERIVSTGQSTAPDTWYDQAQPEWVVLLSGAACLEFADGTRHDLNPGDYCLIPAHCRHRVAWTAPRVASVWLAIHYEA